MKSQKSSTTWRCSCCVTLPTQGAEHLSMYPSRQGRPTCPARLKTPALQVRAGKTRSSRSSVSRIAHACEYGPKYRTPAFFGPRITWSRGKSSCSVTASEG